MAIADGANTPLQVNLSLILINKTSTRLPEATWFSFKDSKNKNGWELNKLGSWVSQPIIPIDCHVGDTDGGLA